MSEAKRKPSFAAKINQGLKGEQSRKGAASGQDTEKFERAEKALGIDIAEEQPPPREPQKQGARVIRDTFSFPMEDHKLIVALRERCKDARVSATKSEIVRAGFHTLLRLPEAEFVRAIKGVVKLKTGRPVHTI